MAVGTAYVPVVNSASLFTLTERSYIDGEIRWSGTVEEDQSYEMRATLAPTWRLSSFQRYRQEASHDTASTYCDQIGARYHEMHEHLRTPAPQQAR